MNILGKKWSLALLISIFGIGQVHAQSVLTMKKVDKGRVRIDGALPEWRTIPFTRTGEGTRSALRFALGYDSGGMFFAAIANDDHLVRTRHPGTNEDAIIVTFAMPEGGTDRWLGSEVWLYAGIAGRQAASASVGAWGESPSARKDIRIVEGPPPSGETGYILEAYIPWAAIAGGERWTHGRATIRLHDVDRLSGSREPVSSRLRDPLELARLPLLRPEGFVEIDPLKSFLKDFDLVGMKPKFDLRGDVSGDNRLERVVQIGTYLVVTGPGHQGGTKYTYLQFPVTSEADVRGARLEDLTGDGKAELRVEIVQHLPSGARIIWQLLSLQGETPKALFSAFLRHEQPEGSVQAKVEVKPAVGKQPASIELQTDRVYGLTSDTFRVSSLAGVEPILVPWGPVQMRSFRWDGDRFAVDKEQLSNEVSTAGTSSTTARTIPEKKSAPPQPQTLVTAFRQAVGIAPEVTPQYTQTANVAEDNTPETLMVLGKNLLVFGPRFRGGTGYFYYEIPAAEPSDVLKVATADLTGDGRAEVLFRIRQRFSEAQRELFLVYQLGTNSFQRLLSAEVKREQGSNKIDNEVHLQKGDRGFTLEIHPGRPIGWSVTSYPFLSDASEGIDPLLLPWKDAAVRYRFDGQGLVKQGVSTRSR